MCVVAAKTGKMKLSGNMKDSIFLSGGFSNWKDATVGFVKHEKTMTHKIAVDLIEVLPCTTRDVGEMLSSVHAAEKAVNRHCLLKIAENIRFLTRQRLPLCGNYDGSDSNFSQLLRLRAVDDMQLRLWMERKVEKFTSPDVQNELPKIMVVSTLSDIAAKLSNSVFFTLMADEVTDVSNKEQVALCLRSTDENFDVHEDFIGLHVVESIKADVLVSVLKDVLLRLNLSINDCRGQCYDGTANMAGACTGIVTQITHEEPKATYTHCHGHALNLAASDAIKKTRFCAMLWIPLR